MAKMHLYQYVFVYGDKGSLKKKSKSKSNSNVFIYFNKGSWKKDIKKRLEMVDMHGQLT